ncbi:hypothetical protein CK516_16955 [Nostoc sp. 'Peltigera malacea cyanobiont' DB3992]|nr:hypothetical protein CK516_16955 [Nostoc sp. 'Peltigera malacea cyanobiont' DB3992]
MKPLCVVITLLWQKQRGFLFAIALISTQKKCNQNLKIFTISHSRTLLPLIENQGFGYYLRKLYVAQYNVGF